MVNTTKSQDELSQDLKNKAIAEGFELVGIARIPGSKQIKLRTRALENWLSAGNQADMNWMEAPRRQNIQTLLKGVKSTLAVGLNYYVKANKVPGTLSLARYGWGRDYHKIINQRLKRVGRWLEKERPNCEWKVCVDSAPLLDKAWAEEAGIGWIAKNSNLINTKTGSWILLGHLLCTEPLTPDKPAKPKCGKCTICIKRCPTQAITQPFIIDSRKCLAYHTIENRNTNLEEEIKIAMGSWVAGCDICQDVCPWNKKSIPHNEKEFLPKKELRDLKKKDWIELTEDTFNKIFEGSAVKRTKFQGLKRNIKAVS